MKHLFIGLCLTLAFTSCQKEELEIIESEIVDSSTEDCINILYQYNYEVQLVDWTLEDWPTNQCYPLLPTSSDYDYVYIVKPWYVPSANGGSFDYVGDELYYLFDNRDIPITQDYVVITVQSLIAKL